MEGKEFLSRPLIEVFQIRLPQYRNTGRLPFQVLTRSESLLSASSRDPPRGYRCTRPSLPIVPTTPFIGHVNSAPDWLALHDGRWLFCARWPKSCRVMTCSLNSSCTGDMHDEPDSLPHSTHARERGKLPAVSWLQPV